MNTINLSLSAVNSFQPQIINGIPVDGIVDGRPVTVRRNHLGGVVPAIGSTFKSTYGTAEVVGYVEGALKARIVQFDENYEFETLDTENPDILDAEECVERLSRCANMGIASLESDIRRLYSTDIGNLSKKGEAMISNLGYYESNEYRCNLSDAYEHLTQDTEVVCDYVHSYLVTKETPLERSKRQAIERKQAVALANKLLNESDDNGVPDDIQAEMNECFGEF